MKKTRPLLIALCAILLVSASIFGTLAYLADSATVVNTFTVGKVAIKLDEAVVDEDGNPTGERTEEGNRYHLIPGATYTKDPTVTVQSDSEEAYVRMLLSLNCSSQLDAIFAPDGIVLTEIFNGYDPANWTYVTETKDTQANTVTYEFLYKEKVTTNGEDIVLDALFDSIIVPANLTGAQLETIAELNISVEAHAIQAVGFADADAAWAAFTK